MRPQLDGDDSLRSARCRGQALPSIGAVAAWITTRHGGGPNAWMIGRGRRQVPPRRRRWRRTCVEVRDLPTRRRRGQILKTDRTEAEAIRDGGPPAMSRPDVAFTWRARARAGDLGRGASRCGRVRASAIAGGGFRANASIRCAAAVTGSGSKASPGCRPTTGECAGLYLFQRPPGARSSCSAPSRRLCRLPAARPPSVVALFATVDPREVAMERPSCQDRGAVSRRRADARAIVRALRSAARQRPASTGGAATIAASTPVRRGSPVGLALRRRGRYPPTAPRLAGAPAGFAGRAGGIRGQQAVGGRPHARIRGRARAIDRPLGASHAPRSTRPISLRRPATAW
jgi:hypothetical protein